MTSSILDLIDQVPDDLLMTSLDDALALAAKYTANSGGITSTFGRSRLGEDLTVCSVGTGPVHILVIGLQHSHETIGVATALEALRILGAATAARDSRLSRFTFDVVTAWDVDAARRSPAAFAPYPTLADYHARFHRPGIHHQPEWAFPTSRTEPARLPETQAMIRLMERTRPAALAGLHNTELDPGGYLVTDAARPELAARLSGITARVGLPAELHPSDGGEWDSPAPGVFVMPEEINISGCISAMQYASRHHGTVGVLPEMPMWIATPTPTPPPTRWRQRLGEIADTAEQAVEPLAAAISLNVASHPGCPVVLAALGQLEATRAQAARCRALPRPDDPEHAAAQWGSISVWMLRLPLRAVGHVLGLLAPHECRHQVSDDVHLHALDQLTSLTRAIGQAGSPELQPLAKTVRAQLAAVLLAAEYAADQNTQQHRDPEAS